MKLGIIIFGIALLFGYQLVYSQLKVKPNGYVGIGTNQPEARLHVYGEAYIDSYAGNGGSAFRTRVHSESSTAYNLWNARYGRDVFLVNGEGWIWSSQGSFISADSSVYENISPIVSPMAMMMQLNGIRFNHRDHREANSQDLLRMGMVAQDVEQVLPGAVRVMTDGLKSVAYMDLVPLLIEAVKEQQEQIGLLQTALIQQGDEINKIKSRRWFRKKLVE